MSSHLEPGALTSPGLLLDRHDLEHLILQTRTQEEVDDLRLLQEKKKNAQTNEDYMIVSCSCEVLISTSV